MTDKTTPARFEVAPAGAAHNTNKNEGMMKTNERDVNGGADVQVGCVGKLVRIACAGGGR